MLYAPGIFLGMTVARSGRTPFRCLALRCRINRFSALVAEFGIVFQLRSAILAEYHASSPEQIHYCRYHLQSDRNEFLSRSSPHRIRTKCRKQKLCVYFKRRLIRKQSPSRTFSFLYVMTMTLILTYYEQSYVIIYTESGGLL